MKYNLTRALFVLGVAISFFTLSLNNAIAVTIVLGLIFIFLIVIGSASIQANFFFKSLNKAPKKTIVLTFDDGPDKKVTPIILDILKKYNIKAHFFVIGKNIEGNEELIKRMHNDGHVIGNHSFHHRNIMGIQTARSIANEIDLTNNLIHQITGYYPTLYRPPFGVTNPKIGRAIKATNMKSMGWSLRSKDTIANNENELLDKLKNKTRESGEIVLLHDRCEITAKILEEYIKYCQEKGMRFATTKSN